MTTKDNFLFLKDNNSFNICHTDTAAQYSDLNLNQNLKSSNISPIQSHSKLHNDKKIDPTLSESYEEKEKSQTWKKLSTIGLCSKYSKILSLNYEDQKCWKKNASSNAINNSTLSVHISVYENSNEASSDSLNKGFQKLKQINPASYFFSQNPLEFQRQQNDEVPEPEVTQFKASQRLLNSEESDFNTEMVINENEFPSLVRQTSTTSTGIGNGHISRTPFNPNGNGGIIPPGTPTAAAITAGLANIPTYGSKDASGSMAGLQRSLYSLMQAPNYNNEFIKNDQDFPALTPTSNQNPQMIFSTDRDDAKKPANLQRGIQAHHSGRVTNIPPGMVSDQYGMAGVLSFLKALDKNNGLVQLALGHDLTNLGLNLGSPDRNLYQSFGGPFADSSVRTQDIECAVPDEYRTSNHIKDKLPPIKLSKLGDDTLFYLFYNCPGEAYQMVAAHELYARDWRYHKGMSVWLTRSAYGNVKEQTINYEKGSYNIFDPTQWRKIPKEMTLEYKDLEQRPASIATDFKNPNGGNGGGGAGPSTAPIPQSKMLPNFSTLNIGASTPTGPQTPGGTVGKPLI